MAACEVAYDYASDDEDLQLDYDEACDEVVELQRELKAEQIEVQQLLMRLKTACRAGGDPSASSQPAAMPTAAAAAAPAATINAEEQRAEELRRLFLWLAENAELETPHILDVGFEVPIVGRTVHLQRVIQWRISNAPRKLLLTAPIEHKDALGNLLASTRATKVVDQDAILHFLSGWDLVAGELTTAAHARPEPSVLLSHRTSTQGILVATWPTAEALQVFRSNCPAGLVQSAAPNLGDRVEVAYEGSWYTGVLHHVDQNGMASVRCDVDSPEVLTLAPIASVRRVSTSSAPAVASSTAPDIALRPDTSPSKTERPRANTADATCSTSSSSSSMQQQSFASRGLKQSFAEEIAAEAAVASGRPFSHRRSRSSAL
eukprot:TRINITY_DN27900_c0_g1_i1.p1 TRINITY_DN27900_c0_g1~~TRINITY_DN27900_c0_g1_i1.p1  ORF type:complete len:375 (-),score=89.34 TRINITY_DN27900_c0_g1_i1:235-1359(-)